MVTLITGGIKSGKSSFGVKLGNRYEKKLYIATAEPFDEEMEKKIHLHKVERGSSWDTIEGPIDLKRSLIQANGYDFILLDCITMWLNNLLFYKEDIDKRVEEFLSFLPKQKAKELIIISNEVGLGVIPYDLSSRRYVNYLGLINQKIADISDRVIFMVSGLPLNIK